MGSFAPYGRDFHTFIQNSPSSTNDWGAGGKHLVAGDGTGKIYVQSLSFYDDAGSDIAWQRDTPYLYNSGNRMYFSRMTLEMETGTVAGGPAPSVTRSYSDNRGQSFSTPQSASMGAHDDFTKRVFWPVAGSSRDRIYRFFGASQSKIALVTCDVDVVIGVN